MGPHGARRGWGPGEQLKKDGRIAAECPSARPCSPCSSWRAQPAPPKTSTRAPFSSRPTAITPAALSLLWEAAGLAPRDADVQHRLGEALERIGALDAAIDAYRRAIAARPDFSRADNSLIARAGKGRPRPGGRRARARACGGGAGRPRAPVHARPGAVRAGRGRGDPHASSASSPCAPITRWRTTTWRSC